MSNLDLYLSTQPSLTIGSSYLMFSTRPASVGTYIDRSTITLALSPVVISTWVSPAGFPLGNLIENNSIFSMHLHAWETSAGGATIQTYYQVFSTGPSHAGLFLLMTSEKITLNQTPDTEYEIHASSNMDIVLSTSDRLYIQVLATTTSGSKSVRLAVEGTTLSRFETPFNTGAGLAHSSLSGLDYASSGHTGFAAKSDILTTTTFFFIVPIKSTDTTVTAGTGVPANEFIAPADFTVIDFFTNIEPILNGIQNNDIQAGIYCSSNVAVGFLTVIAAHNNNSPVVTCNLAIPRGTVLYFDIAANAEPHTTMAKDLSFNVRAWKYNNK
jgi:hypothetical protein